jgi:outer membrane lipoprotein carrier protein
VGLGVAAMLAAYVALPRAATQTDLPPDDLARRVQARYDTVGDFEGQFTQTYEGGVLRTKTTEKGTVVIKRPGKMRWVYTAPERKEFVSDGTKVYAYFPLDKQVMVSPAPTGSDTTPALFLTGRANLTRDFEASTMAVPGAEAGLVGLKLVAKRPDPDFEWLAIGVDPVSFQIRHLVALDRQGGRSTFVFSNLKENRRPPDTAFEFRIPKGVDVITQ